MEDCIFCKIVAGKIPVSKVYENDDVLAFDDIHPQAPVHVIVIPKQHVPTLMDVPPGKHRGISALVQAIQEVARKKGIAGRGFRTVCNCHADGGQVVFHLHAHVLGGRKLEDKMG